MRNATFTPTRIGILLAWALVGLVPALPVHGQGAEPRADFLDALGAFSLALDGTYGDEAPRLSSALDSMAAALSRWDGSIQSRERAMAAEIGRADPQLAARMHLALGGVYLDRLRVNDALREFAAARTSDPTRPEVPLLQWIVHDQMTGDRTAATDALKSAHAFSPKDPLRTYLLARQLMEGDERQTGLELLQQVQHAGAGASGNAMPFIRVDLVREIPGIDPFVPPVLYADGFASLQKGDLPRAIAQLRESLRRDPLMTIKASDDPIVLAAAAFRNGLVSEARAQLEAALAQSPDRAEAHRVFAMVDLADGESARGIGRLRTAVRLNPGDERARLVLANALADGDLLDDAEQSLKDTLQALPSSGRARYRLGLIHQRQGKRADALRELRATLSHTPLLGANTVYRMIGTLQRDEQDLDAAAASFAARVDLVPGDHDAHRDLGEVYLRQGDHAQARAEFEIALVVDPSDVQAFTSLAQVFLREGHAPEAAEASRRALEIDPSHREARYVHATSLMRMGLVDEGTAEMQVFQRLQAEDSESRARSFELGRLRREASVARAGGDFANAVALLRRALVFEPRSATSHLDLGVALLESGQAAEAVERLTTAAALNAPLDVHRQLAKAYAALGQKDESAREQAVYERLKREAISKTGRAR